MARKRRTRRRGRAGRKRRPRLRRLRRGLKKAVSTMAKLERLADALGRA